LTKASVMRISIPLDLSTRTFIPLPRFIRSRVETSYSTFTSFLRCLSSKFYLRTSRDTGEYLNTWVEYNGFGGTHDCEYKYSWLWVQRGHSH
jgi:hypothetical protein